MSEVVETFTLEEIRRGLALSGGTPEAIREVIEDIRKTANLKSGERRILARDLCLGHVSMYIALVKEDREIEGIITDVINSVNSYEVLIAVDGKILKLDKHARVNVSDPKEVLDGYSRS